MNKVDCSTLLRVVRGIDIRDLLHVSRLIKSCRMMNQSDSLNIKDELDQLTRTVTTVVRREKPNPTLFRL